MSLRPTRATIIGGLLGGAATASGIALTATSGWLIVRASEQPVILTLLTAIVGVRAFGIARPLFRYVERLVSHDAALDDLARERTRVYSALVPLTPARLGRRSRSRVLAGVVDDLTDVVDAQVRVTVPVLSSIVAGLVATLLVAWFSPAVGLVLAGLLVAVAATCWLAWLLKVCLLRLRLMRRAASASRASLPCKSTRCFWRGPSRCRMRAASCWGYCWLRSGVRWWWISVPGRAARPCCWVP